MIQSAFKPKSSSAAPSLPVGMTLFACIAPTKVCNKSKLENHNIVYFKRIIAEGRFENARRYLLDHPTLEEYIHGNEIKMKQWLSMFMPCLSSHQVSLIHLFLKESSVSRKRLLGEDTPDKIVDYFALALVAGYRPLLDAMWGSDVELTYTKQYVCAFHEKFNAEFSQPVKLVLRALKSPSYSGEGSFVEKYLDTIQNRELLATALNALRSEAGEDQSLLRCLNDYEAYLGKRFGVSNNNDLSNNNTPRLNR